MCVLDTLKGQPYSKVMTLTLWGHDINILGVNTLTIQGCCDLDLFEDCDCDLISRLTLKLGCDIDPLRRDLDIEIRL